MDGRRALGGLILLGVLTGGCSTGRSGGPTSPSGAADPSVADWNQLAAQISAIAADSLAGALDASGSSSFSIAPKAFRTLDVAAPAKRFTWTAQYACCGAQGSGSVTTSGEIDVTGGGVSVTETVSMAQPSSWTGEASTFQLRIPADALKLTAVLATSGGTIQPAQTFRLEGIVDYSAGGIEKGANVSVVLSYRNFPGSPASDPPAASGSFGSSQLTGGPLPGQPPPAPSAPPTVAATYSGTFSSDMYVLVLVGDGSCSATTRVTGSLTAKTQRVGTAVSGEATLTVSEQPTACSVGQDTSVPLTISGTTGGLTVQGGGGIIQASFTGSFSGGAIPGMLTYGWSTVGGGGNAHGNASLTTAMTLQ